jgi:hypothetical protein
MSQGILLLLDVAFILHLFASARALPDKVASHFQFNGEADGWISRKTYVAIMVAMGPGLSLIWLGLIFTFRNPPLQALIKHIGWAGCLLLAFIFGAHWLTVKANQAPDSKLRMPFFWCSFFVLQIGLLIWVVTWPK